MTLALPALPTFPPVHLGQLLRNGLPVDRRPRLHHAAGQSGRLSPAPRLPATQQVRLGPQNHISTISWRGSEAERDTSFSTSSSPPSVPHSHRLHFLPSLPAARFPLVSFLGSSSSCWQPGTWHEHWFAITHHDIPPRPQQLFTSCRRDHPKSYSQTRTVLLEGRNCVPNHSIALSCPALSFISPPSCRRLAGNQPPLFAYSARLQVRTYLLPESVPLAHNRQHTWTRQQFDIVIFFFPSFLSVYDLRGWILSTNKWPRRIL